MISVIVPSYKNPKCLEICINSFLHTGTVNDVELICIIDGFPEIYENSNIRLINNSRIKFAINENNRGMPFSINIGVYNAINPWILVINDDNVFPKNWDINLLNCMNDNIVVSPNQIESSKSIFNFIEHDFGNIDNFRYAEFLEKEPTMREDTMTEDGEIFPFCISKKLFMAVGGFDLIYPSPFVCDWDFFLKLELLGIKFYRTRNVNFYHFGSIATKKSGDNQDASFFSQSENIASDVFTRKWGFAPSINMPSNSHLPQNSKYIKGISYE